jgi:hypothetical protein
MAERLNLDQQVEAVQERPRESTEILRDAALVGRAAAGKAGLVGRAAAAGIHRRHKLEAGRIDRAVVGARDRDLAEVDHINVIKALLLQTLVFPGIEPIELFAKATNARGRHPGRISEADEIKIRNAIDARIPAPRTEEEPRPLIIATIQRDVMAAFDQLDGVEDAMKEAARRLLALARERRPVGGVMPLGP